MVTAQSILRQVPDPWDGQGRQHLLFALLGLMLLSSITGRKGMKAAFCLGWSKLPRELKALGFHPWYALPAMPT